MNEFSLIDVFFKSISHHRNDVIFGIGDDAACLKVPQGKDLLISCDTLVAGVHFLDTWDAYDIAYKALMVNISDIAAMGGTPSWVTLALTLPKLNESWLQRFSEGLRCALEKYNIALIGGDTTHGPLSITLTIHGLVNEGHAIRRNGAKPGDKIYVSGELGAAALAVAYLDNQDIDALDKSVLMGKLLHPLPRIDLNEHLQGFATAAIDISDGLSADLSHICEMSKVGARLTPDSIPIHPLVKKYKNANALDLVLSGGEDYELCFTVASKDERALLKRLSKEGLRCYPIGIIESKLGLRTLNREGESLPLLVRGYDHFV